MTRSALPVALLLALSIGLACAQPLSVESRLERSRERRLPPSESKPQMRPTVRSERGQYQGLGRDTGGAVRLLTAAVMRQELRERGETVIVERDANTPDVTFIQDSLTIWTDRAFHHRNQGRLELYGNVVMVDPSRRIYADEVIYYEKARRSIATGNVQIRRDSVLMTSHVAEYDDRTELAKFEQDVTLRDFERDLILTGQRGSYDLGRSIGRVPVDPVLVRLDKRGREEARIVGRYMEYDADQGVAVARDSVQLRWEKVAGSCERLYFYPDSMQALMVGSPVIHRGRDEAVGDSIWLFMNEDAIDSAVVKGMATAFTPADSSELAPRSRLEGQRIVLAFVDGEVRRMQSDGQAIGIYHIFQEGEDQGSNRVSGDRVSLLMEQGSLQDVIVVGGTEGTFLPPRLARTVRKEGKP